ncbi:ribosome-associated translation inhibitor RaiA [Maribacter sp. TH_r10]|uniref:Ribosome-associated translation inhibitor RaiA n=1 Tax=Maribacter luteus TaxID=2594478 RepID=A0A6I2MTA4_9FLAO|nr:MULTISPECIES: ribosome-associated translation inhibitor RaiA [Maribacter]MDV7138419.1 ribosome-associated translation inhibitor RaiA [Maribacter sp. TH_r10]MRX66209.1 ribosome-associated translation inhibitor RaiA [Maribacter luteus]|tara:strand:+ start:747 stop:1046 length:300 start_codon:yes stop_codon:yes gene_type:complete
MTINIQYVQMPTSEAMNELITSKLNRLANKFEWVIRAEVHFKKENDPSGKGKICEMELSAPGPRIFASSNEDDFEKAAANTIKDLEKQLNKRKAIMNKH